MQYPTIAQPQYGFAPTMPMMPSMSDMPPAMMAKGGLASAAQNVQSQGRGDDTMLVHMTPGEVGGLQALAMQHGGSLSINPNTGLPEAGFLKNILPTLVGAGLMMVPGLQGVGAGYIGAGVGAVEALRTGDLSKGLLAGLGAFGGANLAGGLMSAGTAANAATAAGTSTATAGGANLTAAELAGLGDPGIATQTLGTSGGLQNLTQVPSSTMLNVGSNVGEAALPALTPTQQLTTGARNIFASGQGGEAARTAFMGNVGGVGGLATDVGMAAAPALLAQPELKTADPEKSTYEGPYVPTPREVRFPTADQQRGLGTSEFQYFTDVNPVPGFQPFSATQSAQAAPTTLPSTSSNLLAGQREEDLIPEGQLGSGLQRFQPYFQNFVRSRIGQGFATGGVPTLEDGGFVLTKKAVDGLGGGNNEEGQKIASRGLGAIPIRGEGAKRGPKAGVDDKIKTSIEGKRPALVSNGEAYVPKKQVAKHGGAKKFYALMSKAEKAAEKRKRA